jgi:hypothetical protein
MASTVNIVAVWVEDVVGVRSSRLLVEARRSSISGIGVGENV